MAITGLDCCITGASENFIYFKAHGNAFYGSAYAHFYSSWPASGQPGPAPDLRGTNYAFDTTTGGELSSWTLPFINPPPGKKTYLGNFMHNPIQNNGAAYFCDRIWQSSGLPISGQAGGTRFQINSSTFPARDASGTSNGENYMVGIEYLDYSVGASNNKANGPYFRYTNSEGIANRTGVISQLGFYSQQTMQRGMFMPAALQFPDIGVRSIEEVWFSGAFTITHQGSGSIVVFRPICISYPVRSSSIAKTTHSVIERPKIELYSGTTPFYISMDQSAIQATTGRAIGSFHYIVT